MYVYNVLYNIVVVAIEGSHYTKKRKSSGNNDRGIPRTNHCKTFRNKLPIVSVYIPRLWGHNNSIFMFFFFLS